MLTNFVNYCKLSYNELVHKTTWPTAKQLTSQAMLVFNASILIALVVFAMDQFFSLVMQFIYPH
ncbi:MAG: preprotein translocase subunit SecE [Bacteroidaceae bacterium]|nr:preprotein translocase subunit SecE [Bacteroidaceae bacterium]MBR6593547.1 preprotein translocase subunit SecE [Prevotella sp.]